MARRRGFLSRPAPYFFLMGAVGAGFACATYVFWKKYYSQLVEVYLDQDEIIIVKKAESLRIPLSGINRSKYVSGSRLPVLQVTYEYGPDLENTFFFAPRFQGLFWKHPAFKEFIARTVDP